MRSTALVLPFLLLAVGTVAQEHSTPPAADPFAPPETRDIWEFVPHLTVEYGTTTRGYVESRYWYRIQDRRTDVEARTFAAELAAGRWSMSGSLVSVPDHPDVHGSTFGLNLTPIHVGPIRPGFGFRYQAGEDATTLFASGGTTIASANKQRTVIGIVDIGVGRFDRSYFRIQGLYGNTSTTNSLDLYVNGQLTGSPLALRHYAHSDFWGAGAAAAIRLYGVSLNGTIACYRPDRPSVALPADECVMSGGGSVLLPLWLKFGSGAGAFVRYARANAKRPPDHGSVQFLNKSFTVGITARIP